MHEAEPVPKGSLDGGDKGRLPTVRLDIKTEVALKRLTARRGQTKSEVIRDAIDHLVEEEEKRTSAFDRLQPFIGIIEGGDPKLSENTGKRFREILENGQSARRSAVDKRDFGVYRLPRKERFTLLP